MTKIIEKITDLNILLSAREMLEDREEITDRIIEILEETKTEDLETMSNIIAGYKAKNNYGIYGFIVETNLLINEEIYNRENEKKEGE